MDKDKHIKVWYDKAAGYEGKGDKDRITMLPEIVGKPLTDHPERLRTTMVYTHVLNRGGRGVKSAIDTL